MKHESSLSGKKKLLYCILVFLILVVIVSLSFLWYTYSSLSPEVYPTSIDELSGTYVNSDFTIELVITADRVVTYELTQINFNIKDYQENVLVIIDNSGIEHYILALSNVEIYSQSHKDYFLRVS